MVISKRNNTIDLLRFIAAVWVVIYHFNLRLGLHNWWTVIGSKGWLGVPIFFIISGYCISIAIAHSKTPFEFIIRRIFRIFPAYWLSLAITGIVILGFMVIRHVNYMATVPKTPVDILATILLLTKPITNIAIINGVYWTLPYELSFYLVVCICLNFKGMAFKISLILITLLSCILPIYEIGPLIFFRYWPLFSLGLCVYEFLHSGKSHLLINSTLLLITLIAFHFTHQNIYITLISIFTCFLVIIDKYYPLPESYFTRLGDLSYSIYLIHVPLGHYIFEWLRAMHLIHGNGVINFIIDILLLTMIAMISKLIYKYVEVPGIRFGKRISTIH